MQRRIAGSRKARAAPYTPRPRIFGTLQPPLRVPVPRAAPALPQRVLVRGTLVASPSSRSPPTDIARPAEPTPSNAMPPANPRVPVAPRSPRSPLPAPPPKRRVIERHAADGSKTRPAPLAIARSPAASEFTSHQTKDEDRDDDEAVRPSSDVLAAPAAGGPGLREVARPNEDAQWVFTSTGTTPKRSNPVKTNVCVGGITFKKRGNTVERGDTYAMYDVVGPDGILYTAKYVRRAKLESTPGLAEFLSKECRLIKKLEWSPNVVNLIAAGPCLDTPGVSIVLEGGGKNLERHLCELEQARQGIPVRDLWRDLVRAVSALHAEQLVHGNLKPASFVLIDGVLKIADLGLSSPIADDKSLTPAVSYAPPERLERQGTSISFASDVWSLGALLFRMVTGKPLFSECRNNEAKRIHITLLKDPIPLPPHLSEDVSALLAMCLRRDPSDRATMRQLEDHPFTNLASTT